MTPRNWPGRLPGPARRRKKNRPNSSGVSKTRPWQESFSPGSTWSRAAQPRNFRLRPGWVRSHRPQDGHDRGYGGRPGEGHGREHDGALCDDSVPERWGVRRGRVNDENATRRTGGDAVPLGPTGRTGRDGRGNESGGGGRLHRPGQGGGGLRAGHGGGTRPGVSNASSDAHGDRGSAHPCLHAHTGPDKGGAHVHDQLGDHRRPHPRGHTRVRPRRLEALARLRQGLPGHPPRGPHR